MQAMIGRHHWQGSNIAVLENCAHCPTSDVQGTAIEITMWKEATDKWFGSLGAGKGELKELQGHSTGCMQSVRGR